MGRGRTNIMTPDAPALAAHAPLHVSVVSHGHGALVRDLLHDLAEAATPGLRVTVTLNVPESRSHEVGVLFATAGDQGSRRVRPSAEGRQ